MTRDQLRYWAKGVTAKLRGRRTVCPSCGHQTTACVARKYVVTELHRCQGCRLLFRVPIVSADDNDEFYQRSYSQGFTTELPDEPTLRRYLSDGFKGSEKDYSRYLGVLDALGVSRGSRVFDFGCSWGYGTWQLQRHGFEVDGFEISVPRGDYGRTRLGVNVTADLPEPTGAYDVFFSAHVLEHVPSVHESVRYGFGMLKPHGIFIAFTPNGSEPFRASKPWNWMKSWGLVHPNLLDVDYYRRAWGAYDHLVTSSPYSFDEVKTWHDRRASTVGDLSGDELCFIAIAK